MNILTKDNKILMALVILVVFGVMANQFIAVSILNATFGVEEAQAIHLTGDMMADAQMLMFPKGQPPVYGKEMGMKMYPDPRDIPAVETAIKTMRSFEAMELTGANFERYKKLGYIPTIACEFCCSVKTLIFQDGKRSCGCAHSYAMRGLLKYMIAYHGNDMSDDEMLQEIIKWKAIYFPKQMMKKYIEQAQTGQFTPDMAALLHGIEMKKGAKVKKTSVEEAIKNLPDMAGGC